MMEQPKVIVSLTSFPPAISYAAVAIESILNGTIKPDKVVLYLATPQFPDKNIAPELRTLMEKNPEFEVRFYEEDIKSYKKLIPALKDFPDDIIVTIDDDVWYHKNMLRCLLNYHKQIPNAIFAHRAKRIKPNAPYSKWTKIRWYHFLFRKLQLKHSIIQTGVGGVLYPPHSLKEDMLDSEIFMKIAPTTDDIWFWAAAVAKETPIIPVPFGHNKPKGLKKPKELSLKTMNFKSGEDLNRAAFERILDKYPDVKKILESGMKY